MSLCDPYKELELYLEQANDEITGFFEGSPDNSPPSANSSDHNNRFAQENENSIRVLHGYSKRPQSNYDSEAEAFLSNFDNTIASEIAELLERSKFSQQCKNNVQSSNQLSINGRNEDDRPLSTTKNDDLNNDSSSYQNGVTGSQSVLNNGFEDHCNSTLSAVEDLVQELNGSQTTLHSADSAEVTANDVNNTGTQTSPTVSHSSSLTWASDYCSSSPCLTSDQDVGDEDNRSSSSTDCPSPQTRRRPQRWPPGAPDLGNKSSSAPVLKKASSKVNKQSRSQSDRHLAEIEATEACKWLRAAGFPQYAQLYEELKFPMDVAAVQQDHPFLEPDMLHSLYRRLWILNQCAKVHQLRSTQTDDSEDEHCALSGNWTYLAESGRWSRVGTGHQNLPFPTTGDECSVGKEWWTASLPHSKPIEQQEKVSSAAAGASPKTSRTSSVKRTGSLRPYRCRRDGVVICDSGGPNVLDILSRQVKDATPMHQHHHHRHSNNSTSATHVSDSECHSITNSRPSRRRKMYSRSLDKSGDWSPKHSIDHVSWHSFKSHTLPKGGLEEEPTTAGTGTNAGDGAPKYSDDTAYPMANFSCGQLQVLRKLSLLKLTSLMESHCPSHRTGWNWELPKFIRKIKAPAYRDKKVFGVPLQLILQRTGQTLPKSIQAAMNWLRLNAMDQVGLFRKPGVKSRIQALRTLVENQTAHINFDEHQPYDVADLIKQYFRDLPEPLLTNKLSETLISVFHLRLPVEIRRQALLCTLLLLPDEHCEALHVLLDFLHHVAEHAEEHQMNATNLALCFAPSLFQINQNGGANRTYIGFPGPRELAETMAAQECLTHMITNLNELFNVPNELLKQCNFSDMEESIAVPLSKLGDQQNQDWRGYQRACQTALLKEARDRGRGWITVASTQPRVELAYKKVPDGHPLRLWRASAEIEAPPSEVMYRILRERHLWDEDLSSHRIVAQLDNDSEIFHYVLSSTQPLLHTDYCVLRTWSNNVAKGGWTIVETSVEHPDALCKPNAVRGVVLASRYLIEPCGSGRSRLLHLARVDTKGRMLEWYNKCYGHVCAVLVSKIQASLRRTATGPESNV